MPEAAHRRRLTPEQQQLVTDNLRLVYRIAHRYKRAKVLPFDDLVGEGCLALTKYIVPGYKPEHGKFSTYAIPAIARYMKRAIRKSEKSKLPQEPEGCRSDDPTILPLCQIPARVQGRAREAEPAVCLDVLTDMELAVLRGRLLSDGRKVSWAELAAELKVTEALVQAAFLAATFKVRLEASYQKREAA